MKTYIDKMRVEIDLRESNQNINTQIYLGIFEIMGNDLLVRKIKCHPTIKEKVIHEIEEEKLSNRINVKNSFCTADYILDDSLDPNIIILFGGNLED